MTVSVEDFADYVGETYADSNRQADLTNSLAAASAHLAVKTATAWREIPTAVYDQMVKDVAKAIYKRAENNDAQYEGAATLTAPNDPLAPVNQILRHYVMSL